MNYLEHGARDWVDTDITMYLVGCGLGFFSPPDEEYEGFRAVKSILWSNNEVADTLTIVIKRLHRNGVLLFDEEGEKYKWNPAFCKCV
jgi:hypothetical protein